MALKKSYHNLIIVSGSPATGKSTVTKLLIKKLSLVHLDWHDLLKKDKKLSLGYDRKKKCYDLDTIYLEKVIEKILRENSDKQYIFDSHIAHFLPKMMVKLAIIVTCSDLKKLRKRLEERKYSKNKVEENLQCEIFEVCLEEAKSSGHNVVVFDSGKRIVQKDVVSAVKKVL
jgi:adenylate kinase